MTNKEAIEYLQKLYLMADITDEYGDMDDTEPYETAIDIAITSLEAQSSADPEIKKGEPMSNINFYIPKDETIPTDLRLYVDNIYVMYERIDNGFRFSIYTLDEKLAMKIVQEVIDKMKYEHDEASHGVSWRTVSLETIPQDERYRINTLIEWKYRVKDSY